jgi:hypothetical protein
VTGGPSESDNLRVTVADRLSIAPGARLWFSPIEWLHVLGPLPSGVAMTGEFAAATVAVVFVSNAGSVRWFLDRHRTSMTMPPAIWVCYPTLGRTDFNRGTLTTMLAGHGLRIVSELPVDGSWTALRVSRFVPGQQLPIGRA